MGKTMKEQMLDRALTNMIQKGYITADDWGDALFRLMTKSVPEGTAVGQVSLFDTPTTTKRGRKLVKGDEIVLMNGDGKLFPFISKAQASLFLNRSDGYVKQCIANNTPIYARTKDGRRGEEYIVWTEEEAKDVQLA